MLSHIYFARGILHPEDAVWPDMELMLYAQDPNYVFVGGPPKSLEEADSKITLAIGSSAANQARTMRVGNKMADDNKMRQFRDSSVFGNGVYLPHGVFLATLDSLTRRLLKTMSGPQPWGRLARRIIEAQRQQEGLAMPMIDRQKLVGSKVILENFGLWLQADTADILLDWLGLQQDCTGSWEDMFQGLRKEDGWDNDSAKNFDVPESQYKPARQSTGKVCLP